MRFLVDNQLPPALARFIAAELQSEAAYVSDLSLCDASDAEIWRYATANDLVVISKDEDFAYMCLERPTTKLKGSGIVDAQICSTYSANCGRESSLDSRPVIG